VWGTELLMFHFAISRSVELCRILTISQFDDDGKPIRRYRLNAPSFTPFEFLSRGDMAVTR